LLFEALYCHIIISLTTVKVTLPVKDIIGTNRHHKKKRSMMVLKLTAQVPDSSRAAAV